MGLAKGRECLLLNRARQGPPANDTSSLLATGPTACLDYVFIFCRENEAMVGQRGQNEGVLHPTRSLDVSMVGTHSGPRHSGRVFHAGVDVYFVVPMSTHV